MNMHMLHVDMLLYSICATVPQPAGRKIVSKVWRPVQRPRIASRSTGRQCWYLQLRERPLAARSLTRTVESLTLLDGKHYLGCHC